ncbi:MAG: hypothetical protein ACHRXM_19415 [Isosphaerales bacterium]
MRRFHSTVQEAAVIGKVQVTRRRSNADITGTGVAGSVSARTAQSQTTLEFEFFVAGVDSATPEQVQNSVQKSVNAVQSNKRTLGDIAPDIYKGLIQDLKGSRRGSIGEARYADIGDIYILEFKHRRGDRELAMMRRR